MQLRHTVSLVPLLATAAFGPLASAQLTDAARPARVRPIIEPGTGTLIVNGLPTSTPMFTVWRPSCLAGAAIDQADFDASVVTAKALPHPTNFAPTSQQGAQLLGGGVLDFQLTLSGGTAQQNAAVAAVETWLEAHVKSTHAGGPLPIPITFASLIGQTGMVTSQGVYVNPYTAGRAVLTATMDADDVAQVFLPETSLPIRRTGSTTSTNSTDTGLPAGWINGVVPNTIVPGNVATITVNSNFAYDYNPADGITAGQVCFQSALAHELTHALGFVSDADDQIAPVPIDYFRFQMSSNNPSNWNGFTNIARLLAFDAPNTDDHILEFMNARYRMSDGNPFQASHFFEQTPSMGGMDPSLSTGETNYPDFLKTSDLRVLDAMGYDWDDPMLVGIAHCTGITRLHENPTSATNVRWRVDFDKRVNNVTAGFFELTGLPAATVTGLSALPGQAVRLDGSNWVDLQNHSAMTTRGNSAFTFECWIKPTQLGVNGPRRNIAAFGSNALGQGLGIYLDTSHRVVVELSGLSYLWSSPVLNDGGWHHVAVTSNGGGLASMTLYVDFVARGTNIVPLSLNSGSAVIGRTLLGAASQFCFMGDIDEARLWDGALSVGTLQANATNAIPANTSNLRACFPFEVVANLGFGSTKLDTPDETLSGVMAEGGGLSALAQASGIAASGMSFRLDASVGSSTSGTVTPRLADFDTIVENRSNAPLNGPGISTFDGQPYTVNHATGWVFCEGFSCPCNNNPTEGTNVGCKNSIGLGAKLRASGSASLENDTVILSGTDMTATSAALYYQTEGVGPLNVLDDGVSCLGGALIRLRLQQNVSGASQYPRPGFDQSISVRGNVTVPGSTRFYSVWYRNTASTYCTPATSNRANAVGMTWTD